MSLPDGLETLVGSGGRPVSAGEGQRLGLARSLLAGGSILLLDEPTAHIDPASSAGLVDDMLSIAGARSVLLVSHDPDIADHVDRVVALGRNSRG
jgi:ABC-type transport system involved in cytochrome bd biosynthesis fused ATPase/permease subunit